MIDEKYPFKILSYHLENSNINLKNNKVIEISPGDSISNRLLRE